MSQPVPIQFQPIDLDAIASRIGRIALVTDAGAKDLVTRRLDRLTRGAVARALASDAFGKLKPGEAMDLAWPAGLAAESLQLVRLPRGSTPAQARKAGAAIGRALSPEGTLILAPAQRDAAQIAFGTALRAYDFSVYKGSEQKAPGPVTLMCATPEPVAAAAGPMAALAEGVFFTRDLVNEPANVLTTTDFAGRLAAMQELGIEVEILEEEDLSRLGMRTLLGVAQGSANPPRVVVMQWKGGAPDAAPLALVGKGVCFDSGGLSLKPAQGMEDMTSDMGGAAVVSGVMRALALRKAKANVVGLVGLVENMPDGRAQRPGDIVRSMKGDTVEIINTDAEGRLVLADVLWYAQERFSPAAMIDLATLTGAIVVALGAENAGVFSNDDALCAAFLKAARAEGEGAWRMPMGEGYDAKLKSRLADMVNSCGREGGSVTAAQFLRRFVKDDTPWIHLDIAGVTLVNSDTALAPKGATGWGVLSLDRLVRDRFEG